MIISPAHSKLKSATTQEHWFLGIVNDAKNVSGNSIGTALALTGSENTSSGPQFELRVARNVTIAVGQTAFLHCRVYQLGDKEVRLSPPRPSHLFLAFYQGFV
ncbi:hypothetical protein QAD02_017071 [Eretmocerus hayati]|uniref:Uncharacterized protein n=1 Tax=Eretmocerus hayati TaxID=131215 RepID=A0ACC2PDB4_9HYME|nr:hypothetical protein QAD02_017071 [Eretmocerus hayati]